MSERTFFTLRYALPGYTFILICMLVAFPTLKDILFKIEVAAFLAFFSLLSGAALGFLVSQVWYAYYDWRRKGRYARLPDVIGFLTKKYQLSDNLHCQIFFMDYVHRLSNEETLVYAQRRFDLMHLCGSALSAAILGSISGLLIRNEFFSLTNEFAWATNIDIISLLSEYKLMMYDLMVIVFFLFLIFLLLRGLLHAEQEHSMAIECSITEAVNSGVFPQWKAKNVFQPHYFNNEEVS